MFARIRGIVRRFHDYSQHALGVELAWLDEGERVLLDTAGALADGFLKYGVRITLTNRRLVVQNPTPAPQDYRKELDKGFEIPVERLRLVSFRRSDLQLLASGRRGEVILADVDGDEHKLQLRDAAILAERIRALDR